MYQHSSFGTNLAYFRKKEKVTQAELAEKIGVTTQTIWRWEHGEREPSLDIIKTISQILNCSETELFNGSQPDKWILQIKLSDNIKEEFIDMTKNMPCVSSITGNKYGANLELSGNWEMFLDDDKFLDFVEQVMNSREAIIQLYKNMSPIWNKKELQNG